MGKGPIGRPEPNIMLFFIFYLPIMLFGNAQFFLPIMLKIMPDHASKFCESVC